MNDHDPTDPQSPAEATDPDQDAPPAEPSAPPAVFVRRGRTPTLAFWVVLALVVPAVAGLIAAPFLGIRDLPGLFSAAVLAAMLLGVPLAGVAALVDAIAQRRRRPRRERDQG